ncbi:hypothetical protein BaRGS_00014448, partial [Batillaria attramentaria]
MIGPRAFDIIECIIRRRRLHTGPIKGPQPACRDEIVNLEQRAPGGHLTRDTSNSPTGNKSTWAVGAVTTHSSHSFPLTGPFAGEM